MVRFLISCVTICQLALPLFAQERLCIFSEPPRLPEEGFDNFTSAAVALMRPHHAADDVLVLADHPSYLEGKFAYGILGNDLKDEIIEVWVDTCDAGFALVGRFRTDSDGRIRVILPASFVSQPGQYRVWLRVVGDNSGYFVSVRAVQEGKPVAVFDIDGTLTQNEDELRLRVLHELISSSYNPAPRAGAKELTHRLKKQNYEIVYLSGRHYVLTNITREWLSRNNFADGTLMLAQSIADTLPIESGVGRFKANRIHELSESGLVVARAYGNASTDIYAYKQAHIPDDAIFVVGQRAGEGGTKGIVEDFLGHLAEL